LRALQDLAHAKRARAFGDDQKYVPSASGWSLAFGVASDAEDFFAREEHVARVHFDRSAQTNVDAVSDCSSRTTSLPSR